MKMKGRMYKACVTAEMVYGAEVWEIWKAFCRQLTRVMVGTMCWVKSRDKKNNKKLMSMVGLSEDIDVGKEVKIAVVWTRIEKE